MIPSIADPKRHLALTGSHNLRDVGGSREDESVLNDLSATADILMELMAAFCVGEVEMQSQEPANPAHEPEEVTQYELGD